MTRAGIGLFPGGAIGAELIRFFYSPLDDRRKEWLERLAEEMRRLKESDANVIERLSKNPEFVSLLTSASIFAYKTHIKAKLDYLANSITNSIKSDLSYDVKQAYINFVDQLSVDHIKILEYARDYRDLNINAKLKSYKDFYGVLVKGSRGVPILSQMDITTFRFLTKDLESKGLILSAVLSASFPEKFMRRLILLQKTAVINCHTLVLLLSEKSS